MNEQKGQWAGGHVRFMDLRAGNKYIKQQWAAICVLFLFGCFFGIKKPAIHGKLGKEVWSRNLLFLLLSVSSSQLIYFIHILSEAEVADMVNATEKNT